jgi:hypothetical protein
MAAAVFAQSRPAADSPVAANPTPTPVPLTLPAPTGPHPLGTVSVHLVDRARVDPWQDSRPAHELMIQLWYPARAARGHPPAPWMSPGGVTFFDQEQGLPSGTLLLPATHAHLAAPVDPGRCGRPVVLYSPGLRSDRSLGTVLIQERHCCIERSDIFRTANSSEDFGRASARWSATTISSDRFADMYSPTDRCKWIPQEALRRVILMMA